MKLKGKLICLILAILTISLGICGYVTVRSMFQSNIRLLADSEREKLVITGRAFGQVGTREDFENMGDLARDAYLKYQFDRCYPDGYALLKGNETLSNKTGYAILSPEGIGSDYRIQSLGSQHFLLLSEPLLYPDGFSVLTVKDISGQWQQIREQAIFLGLCFLAAILAAASVTAFFASAMLRSLAQLEAAAIEISHGKLGCRVDVRSHDEIGQVGAAFNHMSSQVEKQVEDLELLLGALAHEMKTPITSIMGYADTLIHVKLGKEQQEKAFQNIYSAGVRMEKMSSKLLSLVGLYDNESIDQRQIPADRILAQTEVQTRSMFSARKVCFQWECQPGMAIMGDETLLVSLFSNLAENGCKASNPGDVVTAKAFGCQIVIQDQGCGISKKDLPFVKKPFYMADKSRSRSLGGSGLGLALGDRIARLHGASMEIDSQEGAGTCVTVTFPSKHRQAAGSSPGPFSENSYKSVTK